MTTATHNADNAYGIQVFDASINPAARCSCVLLLDISGSMSGQPIEELNAGVQTFFEEICHDDFARFSVEPAVVTFGKGHGSVDVAMPFTSCANVQDIQPPRFQAGGGTPMGEAIATGLNLLKRRKDDYRRQGIAYYQPWMVLLTDGAPTDRWEEAARDVHALCGGRKLVFIGVGVGGGVDMGTLSQICPPNRPPKLLHGLRFAEFFEWLSQSMGAVSRSSVGDGGVKLPSVDGWAEVEN